MGLELQGYRNKTRGALLLTTALCAGLTTTATAQDTANEEVRAEEELQDVPANEPESLVLGTIDITAAPGTVTEDTGSWTTEWMRSATGLPISQKETPQSTSVITDAQMKDRNITSVEETLGAATGITATPFDSERVNFYSRGFAIDAYQFDGVPIPRDGTWQFGDNNADMILYDHVEIVRGATGLMQGAGEPGASINFIRKRPTTFLRREVSSSIAYPTGGRAEADISGPLNQSGTVRGRLLGAIDSREGTLDGYSKDRYVGFGTLEFDLDDSTLLNIGISYQETNADNVTWGGLPPWYSDFSLIDWPWGSTLGADWTYVDTQRTEAYASLEHVFNNGWTGRLVATHAVNDFQSQLAWISPGSDAEGNPTYPDRETGLGMVPWAAAYDGGYTQNSLNAVLNGEFEAMGRIHQFVVGAFGSKGDGTYNSYNENSVMPPVGNIFDWDGSYPEPSFPDAPDVVSTNDTTQIGLYGTAQVHVTDALAVIAGARLNYWDGTQEQTGAPTFNYTYENILTPYIGFTYDLNETYTAYGSVTTIYQPQLVQDAAGDYLDPTYGYNYELGLKAGFFDGALYASAAVFQTNQKDVAEYVTFDAAENRSIYQQIDGTTTRGFEIEAAGAINDRWNASLGYTYRYSTNNDGEEIYTDQPRNTLKAATDYRVPGVLQERLTVGGAVRWQSATDSIPWDGDLPNITQDPFAVFDVNASYDVTEQSTLTLSVNNVLNEKYYASSGFYNSVIYGDGIAAELTLRAQF